MARTMLLAAAVGAALVWGLDRVQVEGTSMQPTFEPGDRLLLVRRLRALRPGDLVALEDPRDPGRLLVKRVTAVGGATAVVVGDNASSSTDSRSFGPVPVRDVRHLVLRRYAVGDRS